MSNVNVTYQQMQDQANKLTQAKQDIETQLTALANQIKQLIETDFKTDQASGQFGASYEEFNTGARKTIEGLEGMATYLNKAAQAFQDVDSQLANALNG